MKAQNRSLDSCGVKTGTFNVRKSFYLSLPSTYEEEKAWSLTIGPPSVAPYWLALKQPATSGLHVTLLDAAVPMRREYSGRLRASQANRLEAYQVGRGIMVTGVIACGLTLQAPAVFSESAGRRFEANRSVQESLGNILGNHKRRGRLWVGVELSEDRRVLAEVPL